MSKISRRNLLLTGSSVALSSVSSGWGAARETSKWTPFRVSLNLGTLNSFRLSLEEEIDIAAQAGYSGIELWASKVQQFLEKGGKLSDVRKRIKDHGLIVECLITFFQWIIDDDTKRTTGIEQMKKNMDWALQLGTDRVAATSSGATDQRLDDFRVLGDRYRTILEIGDVVGVVPMLEIWGMSHTLGSLADALAIAAWTDHPNVEFLLDVYHLFRGGSPFEGLALLNGRKIGGFHVNDYPADPPREELEDHHRVYCGDGIAPLSMIFRLLRNIGYKGSLSFEVFNPTYRETNDPLLVAKTALKKLNTILEKSFQ